MMENTDFENTNSPNTGLTNNETHPHRLDNFCAGPASLPTEVLLKAQAEMLDWQGKGVSIMEMSHRSSDYSQVASQAEQGLRRLLNVPDNYKILFLQGGATLQFSAIPLNLMQSGIADYLTTGAWSAKAIKEAVRYAGLGLGIVNEVASGQSDNFQSVPTLSEWNITDGADYFHYCANETIHGVQIFEPPKVNAPLVCDMSSCILSEPIDVSKFGLIYAGAQKNIGPAGLTIVIVREDLIGHASAWCPTLLDYATQANNDSMANTPATYSWYLAGLVFEWLEAQGGLEAIARINRQKATLLYDTIDNSDFYNNTVSPANRSIMNVPFTIQGQNKDETTKLEQQFLTGATDAGLLNLKGHRSVGGMRASIYNAITLKSVENLCGFMQDFASKHKQN